MELEEKVSEEPRAIDPQKSVVHEPVVDVSEEKMDSSKYIFLKFYSKIIKN